MGCCRPGLEPRSQFLKYPCKKKEEKKPCNQDPSLEALSAILEARRIAEKEAEEREREEAEKEKAEKKKPCEDKPTPSKKKFLSIGPKEICAMDYSRKWHFPDTTEASEEGSEEEVPAEKSKAQEKAFEGPCPRKLSAYYKSLWTPVCKPPEKPIECKEPIDQAVCVFCLESLYTGGYLHELYEKVPLIRKQSELYGDEIGERIGIRTRIIVHKKCYVSYIDTLARKKEQEAEVDFDIGNAEDEESSSNSCGEEEEGGTEEVGKERREGREDRREGREEVEGEESEVEDFPRFSRKYNICLEKYKIPKIKSGRENLHPRGKC